MIIITVTYIPSKLRLDCTQTSNNTAILLFINKERRSQEKSKKVNNSVDET